jgi:hypothetical protein
MSAPESPLGEDVRVLNTILEESPLPLSLLCGQTSTPFVRNNVDLNDSDSSCESLLDNIDPISRTVREISVVNDNSNALKEVTNYNQEPQLTIDDIPAKDTSSTSTKRKSRKRKSNENSVSILKDRPRRKARPNPEVLIEKSLITKLRRT